MDAPGDGLLLPRPSVHHTKPVVSSIKWAWSITKHEAIVLYHCRDALVKFDQTLTPPENKTKVVSGPIFRVMQQSIAKRHHLLTAAVWRTARPCLFVTQNLMKTTILNWWHFAMLWCMTLTIGPLTNSGLLFRSEWCVLFLCLAKLYRSCPCPR